MTPWSSLHVYTGHVDPYLTDVLYPLLRAEGGDLDAYFWERHYAGGSHVRVRLRGPEEARQAVADRVAFAARAFFLASPSPADDGYDPARARNLLLMEGEVADADDDEVLAYRRDEVVVRPYAPNRDKFASDGALATIEAFYQDAAPLIVDVLQSERSRRVELLRMFMLLAHLINEDASQGCIPFRAHWEGAVMDMPDGLDEVIHDRYTQQREAIADLLEEVEAQIAAGLPDPLLSRWSALVTTYRRRAHEAHDQGQLLSEYGGTPEIAEARLATCESTGATLLAAMYRDQDFLFSQALDPAFEEVRVSVNLLYLLVPAVGLGPLDKFVLGHAAYRAIEDRYGTDTADVLQRRIARNRSHHRSLLDA